MSEANKDTLKAITSLAIGGFTEEASNITSIAIGGFDGMHIAHQHLFDHLDENGGIVVIETGYTDMTPGMIRQKHTHFPIYFYDLDKIKSLSGEAFIEKLREDFPSLSTIVIGFDFHFGKNRSCGIEELKKFFSGNVIVVDEVMHDGDAIHSHKIRRFLDEAKISQANYYLGYNYTIYANVILGQGVGSKKLVATMNLDVEGFHLPKEGVYATLSRLDDGRLYPSVSFIGKRHITDGSFAVESHILGETVITSKTMELSFIAHIRENQSFDSFEALKQVIDQDINRAREILHTLEL